MGTKDLVALQGAIKVIISMLQGDLHSLKEEITQLRVTIEVQTQVMAQRSLTMQFTD